MPRDGECRIVHRNVRHSLGGVDVSDINLGVLAGTGQQDPVMGEADGPDWPLQPGEGLDVGQLRGVPDTDQGVR